VKPRAQQARPDWDRLERREFEKLVEAALYLLHAGADTVWSPHDAGGDEGIDVLVERGDVRHVYQLKFFPEGLTANRSRKKQVERSFIKALKHDPTDWTLVMPGKANAAARMFLEGLPTCLAVKKAGLEAKAATVRVHMLDRPALDDLFASHPDLLNLIERDDDYVMRSAQTYGQETAVLAGGVTDVMARASALGELAGDLDAHWGVGFAYDGGRTTTWPVPKHPRAHEVSPIRQGIAFGIPEHEVELQAKARAMFDFGGRGSLTLPSDYVRLEEYTGPEAFRVSKDLHELAILAEQGHPAVVDKPVRLVMRDQDGKQLADDTGRITYGGMGTVGHTLEFALAGGVAMTFQVPYEEGKQADVTVRSTLEHASPAEIRDGAELITAIGTAHEVEVHLDGLKCYVFGGQRTWFEETFLRQVRDLASAADDLAAVQQHVKQRFPMPAEISPVERVWLRAVRVALEGRVAPLPRREVEIELADGVEPSQIADEQGLMFQAADGMTLEIGGVELRLPSMAVAHPRTRIAADCQARTAVCTPAGDEVFVGWFPERLTDTSGHVMPWSLPGIEEPKAPTLRFASTHADA